LNIKEKLVDIIINRAIKANKKVKVTNEQKNNLKRLTLLYINKVISKKELESELNMVLKR
jgi:hypothetical protein